MTGLQEIWPQLIALTAGYLAGSIPFGLILTRLAGLGDIRAIGSGNIGATNVLRTGNKVLALATLLLDGGKGAAAVLVAGLWVDNLTYIAGAAAMIGHLFPVWLRFRGGKGVATFLGVLLALSWPAGVAAAATWLVVAGVGRYSSLAAIVMAATSPGFAWLLDGAQLAVLAAGLAVLLILRHRANIRRLLRGEEPRIGKR